jgi:hypothetical protein
MFELRARGTLEDHQIVAEINKMGFKTRVEGIRDKRDRTKDIKYRGGKQLTLKVFWYTIQNPRLRWREP